MRCHWQILQILFLVDFRKGLNCIFTCQSRMTEVERQRRVKPTPLKQGPTSNDDTRTGSVHKRCNCTAVLPHESEGLQMNGPARQKPVALAAMTASSSSHADLADPASISARHKNCTTLLSDMNSAASASFGLWGLEINIFTLPSSHSFSQALQAAQTWPLLSLSCLFCKIQLSSQLVCCP